MSGKRLFDQVGGKSLTVPHVPSRGQALAAQVQSAISKIAPEWLVELDATSSGETTLVLVPDGGDDVIGPSFLVSQEAHGFRVDQVHWDAVTALGIFASVNDVLCILQRHLAFSRGGTSPMSMTVH